MSLSADQLEHLACPESRQPLLYFPAADGGDEFLFCPASRLKYRVEEGIPVLLVEEAERVDQAEADRLVARAAELGIS